MSMKIKEDTPKKNYLFEKTNIYPNLKESLLFPEKCCPHSLSENTYYCLNCKKSTCPECQNYSEHKSHEMIQKKKIYNFETDLFALINKKTDEAINMDETKNEYINTLSNEIDQVKQKLDDLKEIKIKEINDTFLIFKNNCINLKKNIAEIQFQIKEYKEFSNKFYNLGKFNNDSQNSIFLMHFELFELIKNKNITIGNILNEQIKKLNTFKFDIYEGTKNITEQIPFFMSRKLLIDEFDDFYWNIKQRIKSYQDNIKTVQKTIYDIIKEKGNYDDLNKIVDIFNSKNKKGIDVLFNQNFFFNKKESGHRKHTKHRSFMNLSNNNINLTATSNNSQRKPPSNSYISYVQKTASNPVRIRSYSKDKSFLRNKLVDSFVKNNRLNISQTNISSKENKLFKNKLNISFSCSDDIILDTKVSQEFFSYSLINLYNKLFMPSPRKSFDAGERIFEDYTKKNFLFKESTRPIPGTNEIIIYDPIKKTTSKKKVLLEKDVHGYNIFPEGSRHLYVNNKLYITGGSNPLGKNLSIVLCYDSVSDEIIRMPNMINSHAYHSIEYLDKYECFIVVGGELNQTCEIFDLLTSKWTALPDLNFPRCNICLYFDKFTSDVYALFGMTGAIANKPNWSEVIEVLELNDISSGWIKIEYYKRSTIDLKGVKVYVTPYTSNKLLIKGIKNSRSHGTTMALFLMDKNEIVKATDADLEEIMKREYHCKGYTQGIIGMKNK